MTTKRITKEEIKKNNGREFNRPLNRSDLRFFPVAVITADEAKE
jgi:hypothetical protein